MFPVERRLSGGIVPKKPHPRDYGFLNESEVQRAITAEKQRIKKINQISLLSFLTVFIVASAAMLVILMFLISSPSVPGDSRHFFMRLLVGTISAGTGFVLAVTCWFVAHAFSRRTLPPSSEYGKAKQYLDANWLWKRRLQQEYGYESY